MVASLALLGVCGGAAAYITIRAIGRRASATHSVAYFSLYSTIVSGFLMWLTGTDFVLPTQPKWIALLVCVGIFGLAAQVSLSPFLSTCLDAERISMLTPRLCSIWLTDLARNGPTTRESRQGCVGDIPTNRIRVAVSVGVLAHAHPAAQCDRYGCHLGFSGMGCRGQVVRAPIQVM